MTALFENLEVGQEIGTRELHFTRDSLVRYAGASGDFNPIHYRDDVAKSVGLEGVLAHGMLTMGAVTSPVTAWAGSVSPENPGRVLDVQARFTKPVYVDPETGADVTAVLTVGAIDAEARIVRVDVKALVNGASVLTKAQAVVQF